MGYCAIAFHNENYTQNVDETEAAIQMVSQMKTSINLIVSNEPLNSV